MPLPPSSPYSNATMPPWPAHQAEGSRRLPHRDPPLPPLPQPDLNNVRQQLARPPPRKPVPSPSQLNDSILVDTSQIIPDLPPTDPAASRSGPPPKPSSHSRSRSHPFPALFAAKKKLSPKKPAPDDFDSDSDSDAEMLGLGPGSKSKARTKAKAPVQITSPSNTRPTGDKDFASGHCMTCGALSRWPKGLKVFKCTLCMTINDLVDLNIVIEANSQAPGSRAMRRPSEDGAPSLKGELHQ